MQTVLKLMLTLIFAAVIFVAGTGTGYALRNYIANDQPSAHQEENFSLYWEAWNRVETQFYGQVPESQQTTYGAIRGALATLDDPYTVFIEPEPAAKEKAHLEGRFGGIGAYIGQNETGQITLDPMPERPAELAGIQKDDVLVAIDGITITPEMSVDEVVDQIRGEVGTEVVLTVERADESLDITIERAVIETPSASWRILEEEPTIGYVQLTSFTERSNGELDKAFGELIEQGATAFIFDLRHNGGGLLDSAIDVASQFLADGVVVREDRRNEGERVYDVKAGGKALTQPLAVLVNGGTASASEIVAGALQDYERATLIGEQTFGKGSVQLIYELSDASRLHVTVAKWFTPNNNAIDGVGLQPDIEQLISEEAHAEGKDSQLERAIQFLKDKR